MIALPSQLGNAALELAGALAKRLGLLVLFCSLLAVQFCLLRQRTPGLFQLLLKFGRISSFAIHIEQYPLHVGVVALFDDYDGDALLLDLPSESLLSCALRLPKFPALSRI